MNDEILIGPVPMRWPDGSQAHYSIIKTADDYAFAIDFQPSGGEISHGLGCGGFQSCSDALRACKEVLEEVSR